MNNFILILVSVLIGSIGQVLLKIGANKLESFSLSYKTLYKNLLSVAIVPEILIGLIFFIISFLLWIKVLTKNELSYAYPMVSIGYIIVTILSKIILKENLNLNKILGIIVIIIGVILINRSSI